MYIIPIFIYYEMCKCQKVLSYFYIKPNTVSFCYYKDSKLKLFYLHLGAIQNPGGTYFLGGISFNSL